MASVTVFDSLSSPQRVVRHISRTNLADWVDHNTKVPFRSDVLVDADLSAVAGVSRKYWKHVAGSIVEYTAVEKTAQDAADVAAADVNLRTGAKAQFDGLDTRALFLRAFADILREEINSLRTLHSLPDRTLAQLKTAIQNRVDDGTVDNE